MGIIDPTMDDENAVLVRPGLLVEVEIAYESETERLKFVIVPDEQADFAAGFLGAGTALAQAVLDEPVGREIPYFTGDARSVRILSAIPTDQKPDEETADRRQEKLRQAIEQSDRTNAMIFASSFSGKWGDYDPNAFGGGEEEKPETRP